MLWFLFGSNRLDNDQMTEFCSTEILMQVRMIVIELRKETIQFQWKSNFIFLSNEKKVKYTYWRHSYLFPNEYESVWCVEIALRLQTYTCCWNNLLNGFLAWLLAPHTVRSNDKFLPKLKCVRVQNAYSNHNCTKINTHF